MTTWNSVMQWQQRRPRWKVLSWFCHHILTIRYLPIYLPFITYGHVVISDILIELKSKSVDDNIVIDEETLVTLIQHNFPQIKIGKYIWRTDHVLDGECSYDCCKVVFVFYLSL